MPPLVFIDPVGTGYSRAAKPEEAKNFYGLNEDAKSVGEFIRLYVTKHSRWPSPKFLIGESYGTTRAAALSGELLRSHRMNLNGIMLVSTVLNFQTLWGGSGNYLPHVLYLPSFTAAAWYHQKLPADLQKKPLPEVLAEAEKFASGDYNRALLLGAGLTKAEREEIVKKMARLTGLSAEFVEAANLRVSLGRFNAELLRDHLRFLTARGFLKNADEIHAEIEKHRSALDLSQGCIVHKDLALWNVLGTRDQIAAFIDFDDSIAGDPMDDLSLLACFHDAAFLRRAFAGYQSVRALPEHHLRRFWLHLLRNIIVKAVIRVGAGYFDRDDGFFLIGSGSSGASLREITLSKIAIALRGLREGSGLDIL